MHGHSLNANWLTGVFPSRLQGGMSRSSCQAPAARAQMAPNPGSSFTRLSDGLALPPCHLPSINRPHLLSLSVPPPSLSLSLRLDLSPALYPGYTPSLDPWTAVISSRARAERDRARAAPALHFQLVQPAENHRCPGRTDGYTFNITSLSEPRLHHPAVMAKDAELEARKIRTLKKWQRYGPWQFRVLAA